MVRPQKNLIHKLRPASHKREIILAGGADTRLHPIAQAISQQRLPVNDKPMIFDPFFRLIPAGIRKVLSITSPYDCDDFERLLGDGSHWEMTIDYAVHSAPVAWPRRVR